MLEEPGIENFWVNSPGGFAEAAIYLANQINQKKILVVAEERCASACTIFLAASPRAAVVPGTVLTFHRPFGPDFSTREARLELETSISTYLAEFRRYGFDEKVVEIMHSTENWSANLREQIDIGLINYVYDKGTKELIPATRYCVENPKICG